MIDANVKEFKAYQRQLERLGADVMPRVVAETINTVASFAHVQSIRNVRQGFTLRNQYTERSIRYYKANARSNWRSINAVTGSISSYMGLHDAGGRRMPKQGSRVPMPTAYARGGSTRGVVRKRFRAGQLGSNQFVGKPRGGNRPAGVWERHNKNKRLRMIRSLENETITIKESKWHRDGVSAYAKQSVINKEFIKQAQQEIVKMRK
jgi:hypothetical protein